MNLRIAALVACTTVVATAGASFYQYDDGIADTSILTGGGPNNYSYLTHYTVSAGGETLTSIDLTWGHHSPGGIPDGLTATVLLMDDPNLDGNPNDATIVQSISTVTVNTGTGLFNNYALTPLTLSAGTSFFAGVFIQNAPGGTWAALDTSNPGRSADNWWQVNLATPVGTYNSMSLFGPDFTFFVRVNARPVPEPATMAVLASGAALLLRRRKKG